MQHTDNSQLLPLDLKDCRLLADALGDTPETVISVHQLRRGLCRAYIAGDPAHFLGAVIQANYSASEPTGFGSDPEVLWDLLRNIEDWDCIDVSSDCATALGEIIESKMGARVRYYADIYHTLTEPVLDFRNAAVRQLTLADLDLLESAPPEVQGSGFRSPKDLLTNGIVACAVVSGRIVSIAHTSALSGLHADMGAATLRQYRGCGLATTAASIVARHVQNSGLTPVWSAGEDNAASLRIAEKLGFREVSHRTYVIIATGTID